jgi:hypothetical protein
VHLKHIGSCLPDGQFTVRIDHERKVVAVSMLALDSSLLATLATEILPEDHGVRVFRDDKDGWMPPRAPYSLRVCIGPPGRAVEMDAQVVKLSAAVGGGVAVRLAVPPEGMDHGRA